MIKKIISFFGLLKRQKKQESQEYNIDQQLMSQVLLSKSKEQVETESSIASIRDQIASSVNRNTRFVVFGFFGTHFRNRHF